MRRKLLAFEQCGIDLALGRNKLADCFTSGRLMAIGRALGLGGEAGEIV